MKQPIAYNKLTGKSYPVLNIDFTVEGELNKVVVLVLEPNQDVKLEFWAHIDSPFAEYNGNSTKIVDFEILSNEVAM